MLESLFYRGLKSAITALLLRIVLYFQMYQKMYCMQAIQLFLSATFEMDY
ncbi:hypothetical protein LTSEURB_6751 [Salmonella enterica subsp. enterica serovar Urbana str. R8-2977]|uniref:Uncharacterized protein n=1 Tax=Salmonella enterica subsp. enterica serovar Urbana str. R8-2977 TaxID=913084 RepID=G5S5F2_SALET|nr:hypothetical protein LTSEURB_6751 [Salmonella enterica subsp. enterica serovar Urbana str. R8-2977]